MVRPHVLPGYHMKDGGWTAAECFPASACAGGASCFEQTEAAENVLITSPELSPENAEAWCTKRSGHLASVRSLTENAELLAFAERQAVSSYPWVGGRNCSASRDGPPVCTFTDGSVFAMSAFGDSDSVTTGAAMHVSVCQNDTQDVTSITDAAGNLHPCPPRPNFQTDW